MSVPCVRVAREDGERTRRLLAERDLVDFEHAIEVDGDDLFIPVVDAGAVSAEFEVVERDVPPRQTQTMPEDLLEEAPTYERLGDIALIDEDDPDSAREIADALMASDLPIKTVLNRASKVKGETRVRDWDVLAGDGTETVHREYGCEFALDVAEVYFSPRLATERHRVTEQVHSGENAFDMFCGVGPFVVPFAKRGATVVGTDLNPVAIEYLEENARRNDVTDAVTAIAGDVRDRVDEYRDWADRIVMNLPHSADEFLDVAVALAGDDSVIHYYDIQHEDDPFGPGERAIRDAATGYDVEVLTRHVVRSYAPHEYNVVLDVHLTR